MLIWFNPPACSLQHIFFLNLAMKNYIYSFILLIILYSLCSAVSVSARSYCQHDSDCSEDEFCLLRQCACKPKFVKNGISCFREAEYGEECFFPEQCSDFRQICSNVDGIMKCTCDMYHEYDKDILQCVPKVNLTDMLVTQHFHEEKIDEQANRTFVGILMAGLLVAVMGFICLMIAFFYCWRMNHNDTLLQNHLDALSAKMGKTPPTFKQKPEDLKQLAEASIGPICVDSIVIG